jgi:hypothetical protein
VVSLQAEAIRPATCFRLLAALLCVAASLSFSTIARCGSARDYLNAPIDSWLTTYNASYSVSVTPEDGMDISSRTRSNVFGQSLVVTRTMDYWGRTGGLSVVLPCVFADVNSSSLQARYEWRFRHWLPWQMNIFGGPALKREQFRSFVAETFSSFHLYVGTPLGTYNPTSPINPSANRWTIFPTLTTVTHQTKGGHGWKHISLPNFSRTITIFA